MATKLADHTHKTSFSTKKSAILAGYIEEKVAFRNKDRVPRPGSASITVKGTIFWKAEDLQSAYVASHILDLAENLYPRIGEEAIFEFGGEKYFLSDQLERINSRSAWDACGFKVKTDAKAVGSRYWSKRHVWYEMFRESDVIKKQIAPPIAPPAVVDLLKAIFTVNRSAKRQRDAARNTYLAGVHEFAGAFRRKKEHLYELKDAGIAEAFRRGLVKFVGLHAGMAVFTGGGYTFHSNYVPSKYKVPIPVESDNLEVFVVEAKPKSTKEARLIDAIHTLKEINFKNNEFKFGLKKLPWEYTSRVLAMRAKERFDENYECDEEYDDECDEECDY